MNYQDTLSRNAKFVIRFALLLLLGTAVFGFSNHVVAQDAVSFENDIKPLLEKNCLRCHGPDDNVPLNTKDDLMDDYKIVPGDVQFSVLHDVLTVTDDGMMPPANEGGPLSEEQITLVSNWIQQGAEWPDDVQLVVPTEEEIEEIEAEIRAEEAKEPPETNKAKLAGEITGLLHPLVLHFPIALLVAGAFFAIIGFRGESPLSDAAYYCLWLGALSAILACLSGWFFAIRGGMGADWQSFNWDKDIDVHRWGGIVVAVLALFLAIIAMGSRRRDPYGTGAFWKLSMVLLAALTGYVAHHGGKMTHKGLEEELINKSEQLYQAVAGGGADAVDEDEGDDADDESDSDDPEANGEEGNAETSDSDDDESGSEDEDDEDDEDDESGQLGAANADGDDGDE